MLASDARTYLSISWYSDTNNSKKNTPVTDVSLYPSKFFYIFANFHFRLRLCQQQSTPPPPAWYGIKIVILCWLWHLKRPSPLLSLPTSHCASRNASAVVTADDSKEDLPSPLLWIFVSVAAVDGDRQSLPIWCQICSFVLTSPSHLPFLYAPLSSPPWSPSRTSPHPYAPLYKTMVIIWNENRKNIHRNPIRR